MGVVNWTKLPVLTERVLDIQQLDSTKQISFKGNVSILCFVGNDIEMAKGGVFNVNQKSTKIFMDIKHFKPWQFIQSLGKVKLPNFRKNWDNLLI